MEAWNWTFFSPKNVCVALTWLNFSFYESLLHSICPTKQMRSEP